MPLSRLASIATLCAIPLVPLPAAALTFSGSFSGIAHVESMLGGDPDLPASYYDGSLITGTFSGFLPEGHLATYDPSTNAGLGGGHTTLTFEMKGKAFVFESEPADSFYPARLFAFDATPERPFQQLTFDSMFFLKYQGASFTFEAPAETLFQNGDLTTLRIGPDTVTTFDAYFKDASSYIFVDIDIQAFSLAVAAPVPEPASWAMALLGLVGIGVHAGTNIRRRWTETPGAARSGGRA